jgi:hypothetical protein
MKPAKPTSLVQSFHGFSDKLCFGRIKSPEWFIEDKEFGLGSNGPGYFQSFQVPMRQGGGWLTSPVGDAHKLQRVPRFHHGGLGPFTSPGYPRAEATDHDIGDNREVAKWLNYLESTYEPSLDDFPGTPSGYILALKSDFSGIGLEYADYAAHEGGLPGTIGPDQTHDFVPAYLEANIVDGNQSAKTLG